MQNNSPIHKARIVIQWFEEQQNITLLHWPSKGCDLNLIKNVWGNIVRKWKPEEERYRKQLMSHERREWETFRTKNRHLIQKLVESIPRRMQECVNKERCWTHY